MKKGKKVGVAILIVIAVIFIALFLAGIYAKQEIRKVIDEDLADILTYDEVDVSVINSSVEFSNAEISFGRNTVLAEDISIEGFNYYQYLVNNKIRLTNIEISNPEVILRNREKEEEESAGNESDFEEDILLKNLNISGGSVRMVENDTSGNQLFVALETFSLSNIAVNPETMKNKVPFEYESYHFEADSLKMKMDDQHDFSTGNLSGDNGDLSLNQIKIIPKYDKVEFQKHIPYEKDRFELLVENVSLNGFEWNFKNDSLQLRTTKLTIEGGDLEVHRNKLIRDDPRQKTLYSEKLRNLGIKVDIPTTEVKNSRIVYEEKNNESRPPGVVRFYEVDGEINDITNIGMNQDDFPKTTVHATALFNNEAPVEIDWEFDISNEREEFSISGSLTGVTTDAINSFLRPSMNVEARGGIESLYFTYTGNDDVATGDVRIKYEDFKVNILKDDGTEKSSFWSALANLFISNDAVSDDVNNKNLEVARNKERSFWNYLWLMVREGALASFI